MPDILVRAESADDVSLVLGFCHANGIPVIPRGAGTGVTGGAVPVRGGVVLSLEKMKRVIEIDRENMVAVVEPGAITREIQDAARAEGLMYPPDPASLESCSIGGNVAENAGGPRAVKYGVTKDYILGLEFVLPDGSIITTGGKIVKNATGYNVMGILIGSEGTLAVITKIFLRLIPAPMFTVDMLIPFPTLHDAMEIVYSVLLNRIVPATMEFMERDAINLVAKFLGREVHFPDAGAHLLIQIDGNSEESVHRDLEKIGSLARIDHGKNHHRGITGAAGAPLEGTALHPRGHHRRKSRVPGRGLRGAPVEDPGIHGGAEKIFRVQGAPLGHVRPRRRRQRAHRRAQGGRRLRGVEEAACPS